jgi:hypothetical protein
MIYIFEAPPYLKGSFLKYLTKLNAAKRLVLLKDSPNFSNRFWTSNLLIVVNSAFFAAVLHFLQIKALILRLCVSEIILFAVYCSKSGLKLLLNFCNMLVLIKVKYFFLIRAI